MNSEKAKALLPIITALAEGKVIQYKWINPAYGPKEWQDTPDPQFNTDEFDYRIKPEPKVPRVLYVNIYNDGTDCHLAYKDKRVGAEASGAKISERTVKFIEVIEDNENS